jgi:hypothetical protein
VVDVTSPPRRWQGRRGRRSCGTACAKAAAGAGRAGRQRGPGRCFFSLFITPALRVWGRARAPVLCGFGEGRVPLCCEGQAAAAARRRRVGQAGAVERAGVAFFFLRAPLCSEFEDFFCRGCRARVIEAMCGGG